MYADQICNVDIQTPAQQTEASAKGLKVNF